MLMKKITFVIEEANGDADVVFQVKINEYGDVTVSKIGGNATWADTDTDIFFDSEEMVRIQKVD